MTELSPVSDKAFAVAALNALWMLSGCSNPGLMSEMCGVSVLETKRRSDMLVELAEGLGVLGEVEFEQS